MDSLNHNTARSTVPRRLLIANPSADVYGSDLQMLETVTAMVERGWEVVTASPDDGPLVTMLRDRGARVHLVPYPVLRRANASLGGMIRLALDGLRSMPRMVRLIRRLQPDVVYVNTVTLPWWLAASRLARTPVVCHVHEAEDTDSAAVRFALTCPLLAASELIVISRAAMKAATSLIPRLARRANLIYNGVPNPGPLVPPPDPMERPFRLACIGRLSPRKGTDVALEVAANLRHRGHDVDLELCGTPFAGYEWFEDELRSRAKQPDLAEHVTFSGYISPVAPALHRAHALIAPSLREPFGNAVVEAQLAGRPVVAAAAMGHLETVQHGQTGLLAEVGSSDAMADEVEKLILDPALMTALAQAGRARAEREYAPERYRSEVARVLDDLAVRRRRRRRDRRRERVEAAN